MLTEHSFTAGETTLNYAEGPKTGPPLLFLHGVTRRWQDFVPLVPQLAWRWQVFALDQRGHGLSKRADDGYLVVDYVRDATRFLNDAIGEPAVVYGHSLGAMVAAGVAAEGPENVRGVILEDPPFATMAERIRETPFLRYFSGLMELARRDLTVEQLAQSLADMKMTAPGSGKEIRLGDVRDATSLRFSAKCLSQLDPRVLQPIVEGRWLEGIDRDDVLQRIECPALLLQGEVKAGGMLPDEDARRAVELLRRGMLIKVQGVGHLIHWMETQTTERLVQGFLESL